MPTFLSAKVPACAVEHQYIVTEPLPDVDLVKGLPTLRDPERLVYYKPDAGGRYSFMPRWDAASRMGFECWIDTGRLPANPAWAQLAPAWISSDDLSPLSLEYRAEHRDGGLAVDAVFRIEEPDRLAAWIAERTGQAVAVQHVNRSGAAGPPPLGQAARDRIRTLLPRESALYGV